MIIFLEPGELVADFEISCNFLQHLVSCYLPLDDFSLGEEHMGGPAVVRAPVPQGLA